MASNIMKTAISPHSTFTKNEMRNPLVIPNQDQVALWTFGYQIYVSFMIELQKPTFGLIPIRSQLTTFNWVASVN